MYVLLEATIHPLAHLDLSQVRLFLPDEIQQKEMSLIRPVLDIYHHMYGQEIIGTE